MGNAARQTSSPVRLLMVGCGGMARHHIRRILEHETTDIRMVCEPSGPAYELAADLFEEAGRQPPPNVPDLGARAARTRRRVGCGLYHHASCSASRPG